MASRSLTMAQQVALAATEFQQERTGHAPKAATVVLSEDLLAVTLHDALSPAEMALARTIDGAAQVRDFHRTLFQDSVDGLRDDIRRITGVAVCEAAIEVETTTGAVVQVFTTGTVVQMFQLAGIISAHDWNSIGKPPTPPMSAEDQELIDEGNRLVDDLDAMEHCPLEKLWQIHDAQKKNRVTSLAARMFEVHLKLLCR